VKWRNFWRGVGSILELMPVGGARRYRRLCYGKWRRKVVVGPRWPRGMDGGNGGRGEGFVRDAAAIQADWDAVGREFWRVVGRDKVRRRRPRG
jgi:hypothetical protein